MINYANESDDYLKYYVEHREESIHNLHEAIEVVKDYEAKIKPVLGKVGLGLTMETTFGQVLTAIYSELGIYTHEVAAARKELERRKCPQVMDMLYYDLNGRRLDPITMKPYPETLINPEAKD